MRSWFTTVDAEGSSYDSTRIILIILVILIIIMIMICIIKG
jgi:hypothetical protein